ncbi:hypothetical protein G6N05_07825 [Flavobacterium sp. F372]|uniref:Uncharacterized protein n=1 Tax=Flavobacterium bernardetii TaxID=2813823 RepID=A0ABR7IX32_9FLAO|nr:hypothetical protein [Flavobacterium bernardetii]MBC5834346.1 hypothetical protein [Flavobacterium bernardetii]NHF70015.1 hypothetical protein [Flavobacterium bernardetii]
MKKVVYILAGIIAIGVIGNLINPRKKEVKEEVKTENKPNVVKNEKKSEMELDNSEFWTLYDPMVKERIYKLIEDKDCKGLQDEFNVTAENMDRLQKTGKSASRNIDLMDFLEDKMKELGCH